MQLSSISKRGHNYGVQHFLASAHGELATILNETLSLSSATIEELFWLGAVYLNNKRCVSASDAAVIKPDSAVKPGDYIRVHTTPRRYSLEKLNNPQLVIFENEDFIVVNKPAGIPVHATVDNCRENMLCVLSQKMQIDLKVTHRLDIVTQGLIVFAKNREFQKTFNQFLSESKVKKIYRALVHGDNVRDKINKSGQLIHYMEPSPRAPKKLSEQAESGWQKCILKILDARSTVLDSRPAILGLRPKILDSRSALLDGTRPEISKSEPEILDCSEIRIELETGRTHQIRAQLSYAGHPIIGDTMYGSSVQSLNGPDSIALECNHLSFGEEFSFTLSENDKTFHHFTSETAGF